MIKLSYEQYCEECKYFDPETEVIIADSFSNDDEIGCVNTEIKCKSRHKCARMYKDIKRRVEKYDRSKAEQ